MNYLNQLNWRYATKRMNHQKVSQQKIDHILEAIRLSASSMGLQPYTVLVIEDDALRKQIQPIAFNQPQITEASHLLVFAAWDSIPEDKIADYLGMVSKERSVTIESLQGYRDMIRRIVAQKSGEDLFHWNSRQAYIALGSGLMAAALEEVDSTPIEGFNAEQLDALLHLTEKGLRSVVLMTLGYRDSEKDQYAKIKKVRRSKEKLFQRIDA